MKIKPLQAFWIVVLLVLVSGGFLLSMNRNGDWPPVQPTSTSTATQTSTTTQTGTPTSPPDLGYEAVTMEEADCFDWSYQSLADIDPFEPVRVLGTNQNGDWYRVRWPKVRFDCWVESRRLNATNFSHEELYVISNPFPPVFTPTLTFTATFTPSPTFGNTLGDSTATMTKKPTRTPKTPASPTSTPTPTATKTARLPSDTPTPTPTFTYTATYTRTPTSTKTFTPTPTPCPRPAAPRLSLNRHGQNVDLTWGPIPDAVLYEVYRSEGTGGFSLLTATTATSLRDSLPNSVTYHYYVIVTNSCGEQNTSNIEDISR